MISSATDLWEFWTTKNILRGKDYDSDIVAEVLAQLGDQTVSYEGLTQAMDSAGWDARDLLHAVLPVVSSFSGMLTDLLELYTRVDARQTERDSLRISYEFVDGNEIDESLAAFREYANRLVTVRREVDRLSFDSGSAPWMSPLKEFDRDFFASGREALGIEVDPNDEGLRGLRLPLDIPLHQGGSSAVRDVQRQHHQVVIAVASRLADFGNTYGESLIEPTVRGLPDDAQDRAIQHAATDFWVVFQIGMIRELPAIVADLEEADAERLLQRQADWIEQFWRSEGAPLERQIEDLTDALSLPHWGQRFDLYSTWLVTVVERALGSDRVVFDVSDGVLAFPFRPTLLARIHTSRGPLEFWAEKRFSASDLIGKGRTRHIQPDYVFVNSSNAQVEIALEAKQYKTGTSKNPGKAAHDYARNLAAATVFVVAHGPLRPDSIDIVRPDDRPRVEFHSDVRPTGTAAIGRLSAELLALLPAPAAAIAPQTTGASKASLSLAEGGVVALRWDPTVLDLDLHVRDSLTGSTANHLRRATSHALLGGERYNGGPETAVLPPSSSEVYIAVQLYSTDVGSVFDAFPEIDITTSAGSMRLLPSAQHSSGKEWRVARVLFDGEILPLEAIIDV